MVSCIVYFHVCGNRLEAKSFWIPRQRARARPELLISPSCALSARIGRLALYVVACIMMREIDGYVSSRLRCTPLSDPNTLDQMTFIVNVSPAPRKGEMATISSLRATVLYSPYHQLAHMWRHRDLIIQLTRRELTQRYRSSYLGMLWTVINPLLMLMIYTFIFSTVFQAKWGTLHTSEGAASQGPGTFALTLFAGLIAFNVFAEVLNRAPVLILQAPNYVKKVVFPLEILPVVVLNVALVHSLISLGILMVGVTLGLGLISPMMALLPLAYLPLLLLCLGLGWFLASLGVYVHDTGHGVVFIVQVLFFMSPIFYPISAVPEHFRSILYLNPLTTIIDGFRRVLLWQQPLAWPAWSMLTVCAAVVAWLGYLWFMKTKGGFADVI